MRKALLFIIGAVIFGVTFAAWWWLNAFACGMSPNGCTGYSLAWDDWEALQFFVPTFVLGGVLMVAGLFRIRRG